MAFAPDGKWIFCWSFIETFSAIEHWPLFVIKICFSKKFFFFKFKDTTVTGKRKGEMFSNQSKFDCFLFFCGVRSTVNVMNFSLFTIASAAEKIGFICLSREGTPWADSSLLQCRSWGKGSTLADLATEYRATSSNLYSECVCASTWRPNRIARSSILFNQIFIFIPSCLLTSLD